MYTKPALKLDPEQDYRIFFIFMTIVLIGMYFVSMTNNPVLHQFWYGAQFTILMTIHLALHWMVVRFIQTPKHKVQYIIVQGLLALFITDMSRNTGMVFSLYMALIGETIGFLGISRWSVLSTLYFLALALINIVIFTDLENAIYWIVTVIPLIIFIGMYVTMYVRQADAREKAQALASELEAANRQLTEYSARVEDLTIANERQRMARELHDTLSQGLAGLILQLEAADAHLSNDRTDRAQAIVTNAMQQARLTLADARRAIDDLRQPPSDDLDSALRLEISRFTSATAIPIRFHSDPPPPLPDPVKETIVRAVAEALNNVAQHARARNAEVNVRMKDKSILVTIQDDGLGFDASSIPPGHYGILGIQERVRLVDGSFAIRSEREKGTNLEIEIPIRAAETNRSEAAS